MLRGGEGRRECPKQVRREPREFLFPMVVAIGVGTIGVEAPFGRRSGKTDLCAYHLPWTQ
jgi:hypothetical protein